VYLHKKGIEVVGTVRRNRTPDSKLPSEEELKNEERGKFRELVVDIEGVDVSCVIWKDNKYVVLLSTYAGSLPTHEVQRYDRKAKKKVAVQCPDVVREYNMHMGGVDILDSIMARYRITFRSKKWYFRLFYHFLDMTVANVWLLYWRTNEQKTDASKRMTLKDFKAEVAHCLLTIGHRELKRGRPSSEIETEIQKKKHKGPASYVPPSDVRRDGVDP